MKKNFTISIPLKKFWTIVVPVTLGAIIIASVVSLIIVDRVIMPKMVGVDKDLVIVPDITGLQWESARKNLFDTHLRLNISDKQYDEGIEAGHIIAQMPTASTEVKKNRYIDVVVSKGSKIATIPNVVGTGERQARIILKKHGIDIEKTRQVFSDEYTPEVVAAIFPPEGSTISREIGVELHISKGVQPTHSEVPNLVGESIENAERLLRSSGLKVGEKSFQNRPDLEPGTIISQSISPGSQVEFETAVGVVVSITQ